MFAELMLELAGHCLYVTMLGILHQTLRVHKDELRAAASMFTEKRLDLTSEIRSDHLLLSILETYTINSATQADGVADKRTPLQIAIASTNKEFFADST